MATPPAKEFHISFKHSEWGRDTHKYGILSPEEIATFLADLLSNPNGIKYMNELLIVIHEPWAPPPVAPPTDIVDKK